MRASPEFAAALHAVGSSAMSSIVGGDKPLYDPAQLKATPEELQAALTEAAGGDEFQRKWGVQCTAFEVGNVESAVPEESELGAYGVNSIQSTRSSGRYRFRKYKKTNKNRKSSSVSSDAVWWPLSILFWWL